MPDGIDVLRINGAVTSGRYVAFPAAQRHRTLGPAKMA
jgi:hypothetical protein